MLNVVNGDKEAVDALLTDPRRRRGELRRLDAGRRVHLPRPPPQHGKRVQALGGAKNHMVVMPDADLDQAADALMGAAYGSAGERCMAISVARGGGRRAATGSSRTLKPRLARAQGRARHRSRAPRWGRWSPREHLERVRGYVDLGVEEGATLVVDGRGLQVARATRAASSSAACLFDHVTPAMRIYREEIFGPVLVVVRVPDLRARRSQLVNEHEYGNGTAIFTRDGDAAREFASRVQVGMVGVNVPIPVPMAFHSFGGWKRSLFGDHCTCTAPTACASTRGSRP